VDLYIHSPIRLHGVMLNQLNIGTTLPFTKRKWLRSTLRAGKISRCRDKVRAVRQGFDSQKMQDIFLYCTAPREPTQPPIEWVSGTLSPGVKPPVREADLTSN
jgi:hypothetical protein